MAVDGTDSVLIGSGGPYTFVPANLATRSVVIGLNCNAKHTGCVLIGNGLTSDHDYQVKVGNLEAAISREMTPAEFQELYATLVELVSPR